MLIKGVSEITEIIKMIFLTLVCSLELDIKVLLLKAAQTLMGKHGEIKLLLARTFFPCCLAFIVHGSALQFTYEVREVINNVKPVNYSHDWSGKICIIRMNIMREAEQFLFGFKAHLKERNSWLLL